MKCITGLWDIKIPLELLQDIQSRLGLKDNIRASAVCNTWLEAAISVRKFQPSPWFFHTLIPRYKEPRSQKGDYILSDQSRSQTYQLHSPELKNFHRFPYSRDGWLLVLKDIHEELFLLNPFTEEHIYLPKVPKSFLGRCSAFSAAPTSSRCLVFSLSYLHSEIAIMINTWRPGETEWTTHRYENHTHLRRGKYYKSRWYRFVFSNGMFYCLSTYGYLGVFDPPRATWNILPVNPCPAFGQVDRDRVRRVLLTEHEGDIFVMFISPNMTPLVFKLNLNKNVWEDARELGGLTVFASCHVSLTRAGLPSEMRNKIYLPHIDKYGQHDMCYSLGDDKRSRPPPTHELSYRNVWVDPPRNVNL